MFDLIAGLSPRWVEAYGLSVFDAGLFTDIASQTLRTRLATNLVITTTSILANARLLSLIAYLALRTGLPSDLVEATSPLGSNTRLLAPIAYLALRTGLASDLVVAAASVFANARLHSYITDLQQLLAFGNGRAEERQNDGKNNAPRTTNIH